MIALSILPRRLPRLILSALLSVGMAASAWADAQRIALVGSGFGKTEVNTIRTTVIQKHFPDLPIEECGDFLDAERFKEFSGVVLGGGEKSRPYTPEETEKIHEWVKNGGRLLLVRMAPRSLVVDGSKDRDSSYLFGRNYYMREGAHSAVVQPNSPILEGALEQGNSPFWLKGNVLLKGPDWAQLVGENEAILVGKRDVGKGAVYFLGSELFRVLKEGRELKKTDEAEGWARIIQNILSEMTSS